MAEHDHTVLDLPENREIPKARMYTTLLFVSVALVLVAAFLRILHYETLGLVLFCVAWIMIAIHFMLKVVANFKFYKQMCVRDLGRLGVITAIMLKMMHLPFAMYLMIASGCLYAAGYFGDWLDGDRN